MPLPQFISTDILHELVQRFDDLQRQFDHLQASLHLNRLPPHRADISTQTADDDLQPHRCSLRALTAKISSLQHTDTDICQLRLLVGQNVQPDTRDVHHFSPSMRRYLWQLARIELHDDLLYRRKKSPDRVTDTLQLLVPASLVNEVLDGIHSSSHERTLNTVAESFYWPFMHRDCNTFRESCISCNDNERAVPRNDSTLHAVETVVCAITDIAKDILQSSLPQQTTCHSDAKRRRKKRSFRRTSPMSGPQSHSLTLAHRPHSAPSGRQSQSPPSDRRPRPPSSDHHPQPPPTDHRPGERGR